MIKYSDAKEIQKFAEKELGLKLGFFSGNLHKDNEDAVTFFEVKK